MQTDSLSYLFIGMCSRCVMGVIICKQLHHLQTIQEAGAIKVKEAEQEENLWYRTGEDGLVLSSTPDFFPRSFSVHMFRYLTSN